MCGFVGFMGGKRSFSGELAGSLAEAMAGRIDHRGPDGTGLWTDADAGIALAHKRLAIIDLSPAGAQPMLSTTGRYVIVYNGEIYNHPELRRQLQEEGHSFEWRGHSDTETLLAGIEAWGLQTALQKSIGMFAFALWDRERRHLVLARDRVGEKPLYYGWQGAGAEATFLFGSELKALARHPSFDGEVDRGALSLFMRHSYVPTPYSIFRGIRKLPPGSYATIRLGQHDPRVHRYWIAEEMAESGVANPLSLSPQEAVEGLETLLLDAVGRQMMADVPLGAFLSGGIDSSTIVALMQVQSTRPVKTFTIGFHERAYDEAHQAKAVARYLGTDHTDLYVTPDQAMAVIPRLPAVYDEPFADSSQIPTFLVSQLARTHVSVSLSGDAGDELFGGYNRYAAVRRYWQTIASVPRPLRRLIATGLQTVPTGAWDRAASMLRPVMPRAGQIRLLGEKVHKGASVLASRDVRELYYDVTSYWRDPTNVVLRSREPPTALTGATPHLEGLSDVERMMALDLMSYLPDDILVKVDRAAMAVSLETRVPMLDHRVVEYAWRLPITHKLRDGETKWPLRQILFKYVPRKIVEQPKMGFGVPIDKWLRGPLRDWAETLLDEGRIRQDGFLDPTPIRKLWSSHQEGSAIAHHQLWNVLMFQSWLENQRESTPTVAAAA